MHDPESYYPRRFITDFETFWNTVKSFDGDSQRCVANEPLLLVSDFVLRKDGTDFLSHIHKPRRMPFMYGILFSIFWDQLLHTHYGPFYDQWDLSLFQQGHRLGMDHHPKLLGGDGSPDSLIMVRPWQVFSPEVLQSRDWKLSDVVTSFRPYVQVMVEIWGRVVERHDLLGLDWVSLCQAMMHDPHVAESHFGRMIQETAQSWHWSQYHAA